MFLQFDVINGKVIDCFEILVIIARVTGYLLTHETEKERGLLNLARLGFSA